MKEYDRFEKGAANGNSSTRVLQRQLENKNQHGGYEDYKIIVTTIDKAINSSIELRSKKDLIERFIDNAFSI